MGWVLCVCVPGADQIPSFARRAKAFSCAQNQKKAYELSHPTTNFESGISNVTLIFPESCSDSSYRDEQSKRKEESLVSEEPFLKHKDSWLFLDNKNWLKTLITDVFFVQCSCKTLPPQKQFFRAVIFHSTKINDKFLQLLKVELAQSKAISSHYWLVQQHKSIMKLFQNIFHSGLNTLAVISQLLKQNRLNITPSSHIKALVYSSLHLSHFLVPII